MSNLYSLSASGKKFKIFTKEKTEKKSWNYNKQRVKRNYAGSSYANCLKQKGIATDIISESIGHQNIAITQAYLKELDNSLVDEAMEVLL